MTNFPHKKDDREAEGVASWLVINSSLTFGQIARFCDLPNIIVEQIADDARMPRPTLVDPIQLRLLTIEEKYRCERNIYAVVERPIWWRNNQTFQDFTDADFVPHKISLGKVYFLSYGRNAWHSTWIERYYTDGSIEGRIEDLKHLSEKKRVQGNKFIIEELPAIALQSDHETFILLEINKGNYIDEVLKAFDGLILSKKLLRLCGNTPRNSVLCFSLAGNIILEKPVWRDKNNLGAWRSIAEGTNYPLKWLDFNNHSRISSQLEIACDQGNRMISSSIELTRYFRLLFSHQRHFTPSDVKYSLIATERSIDLTALCNEDRIEFSILNGNADYESLLSFVPEKLR